MMNYADYLKKRLSEYKKEDIIFTEHARYQAVFRNISIDEIRENIINPNRLYYAYEQAAMNPREEKFDCYFGYSKTQCQRYILILNGKCIVSQ